MVRMDRKGTADAAPLDLRLREAERAIVKDYAKRIDSIEWLRPGAAVAAALGAWLAGGANLATGSAKPWLIAFGISIACAGAVLVALLDRRKLDLGRHATDSLALADEALREVQRGRTEREQSANDAKELELRLRHRLDAIRLMRETLEQQLDQCVNIESAAKAMLDAAAIELGGAGGFEPGEDWGVSIFAIDAGSEPPQLVRIAALRADRLAEALAGRSWALGEGFTGVAWERRADVIEDDASQPVAGPYPMPSAKRRDHDATRYRSVAVALVRTGAEADVWGAVTATSDRTGRFRRKGIGADAQPVELVRDVAGMMALLAVAAELPEANAANLEDGA